MDDLDAQTQSPLRPLLAPTPVAGGVHPRVGEPGEAIPRTLKQQPDAVLVGDLGAVNLRLENQPSVSTSRYRFRPRTFLPPS